MFFLESYIKKKSVPDFVTLVLYSFLPLLWVISILFRYDFTLYSNKYHVVLLCICAIIFTIYHFKYKDKVYVNNLVFISLFFLSILNGAILIFLSGWLIGVVFSILSTICFLCLICEFSNNLWIKIFIIIVSIITIIIFSAVSFFIYISSAIFDDFGYNKVVKTILSPNKVYVAHVIDNDQGTFVGGTYVDVKKNSKDINLIVCKLSNSYSRIYSGEWREYEDMKIDWVNDYIIKINNKEYNIK